MARVEAQNRAIQLTLPEASTVYVFPRRQEAKAALGNVFPQSDKPSLLEQPLINAIVQDRLDRGADDMDGNGHLAKFESRLKILRSQGVTYEKVVSDIKRVIGEIRLEGRTFESRRPY